MFWDAWDVGKITWTSYICEFLEVYHLEKGVDAGVGQASILEKGPLRASIVVHHPLSKTSTLKQVISLSAVSPRLDFDCNVQWNENRKFLVCEGVADAVVLLL